jgi:hypothetical protein
MSMGVIEQSDDVERLCQAVSPNDEPCDFPATVHCAKCGRWFCDAHAEDQEWHPCMLPLSEKEAIQTGLPAESTTCNFVF